MNNIKISILVPCYNGENHIEVALESFLMQNNPDLEMIIVDDGSVDRTADICNKYTEQNNNIRFVSIKNAGAGHARNIAIDNAKGNVIGFLDSDDALIIGGLTEDVTDKIEKIINSGMDIIYAPRIKSSMDLKGAPVITLPESIPSIVHNMPKLEFWTCFYSKSFLNKNRIRFYEYREQDIESAFRYCASVATTRKVVLNDLMFYIQRDNLSSNTHTWNKYNLYRIKSKVFADLFTKTKCEDDKAYLFDVAMDNIVGFYKLCFKHGYCEKEDIRDVHKTFIELISYKKYRYKCEKIWLAQILDTLRLLCLIRKCKLETKKQIQEVQNTKEVINRLVEISEKLLTSNFEK